MVDTYHPASLALFPKDRCRGHDRNMKQRGSERIRPCESWVLLFEGATAIFALAYSTRGAGSQRTFRPPVRGEILFLTSPFIELAAAGRRASHAGVFWQQASKDRGAAAAGRVANQERQRIERAEAIQWREVSAVRPVGSEKQARAASGPAKRAAVATQPWPR